MHNGAALYARDAGKAANADDAAKLDGLAPQAYIQTQDGILDNGDFRKGKIVNQKAQDSYKMNGYTIDRFIFYSDAGKHTLTIIDDGIVLSSGGTSNPWIRQISEDTFTIGNMYTYTVQAKASVAGNIIGLKVSNTDNYAQGIIKWFESTTDFQNFSYTFSMPYKHAAFELIGSINGDITASRLKLEPGNRFTGWPVWNYALELAKCQRHQIYISGSFKCSTTAGGDFIDVAIPVPTTMRTTPICQSPSLSYIYHDGNSYEASNFTYNRIFDNGDHTNFNVRFACATKLNGKKTGSANLEVILNANL